MKDLFENIIDGYSNNENKDIIGIFGNPIKHTLSPLIHNTLSDKLGINEQYLPFWIKDDLGEYVKAAFNNNVLGLNITVPYKQKVMEFLCDIDCDAKAIGAVNTLVKTPSGYVGYNTDMPGLKKAINDENIYLEGKNIVMLGAGGAARAVAYMCKKDNAANVYIVNRSFENANKLADDMNEISIAGSFTKFIPISSESYSKLLQMEDYYIIQCTSVGLDVNDGLPLIDDESFYKQASFGVDLIYNPAKTKFIRTLEKYNVLCMNGLKMLVNQAIFSYQLWNNVEISKDLADEVYRKLYANLYFKKKNNIVLIGFMGSGKSTVGKALAKSLNYEFIDTDEYIEKYMDMKISDIFEKYGEEYFRSLETKILFMLNESVTDAVVSTGGGMPVKEDNHSLLKSLGKVFWLDVSSDTVYKRLKNDTTRPLLKSDNPYEKIVELLNKRYTAYQNASDYVVDVNRDDVEAICNEILKKN